MEDVLTENPPPSRFFQEDLNNFTPPSPPLPSPFLVFSTTADLRLPLRPSVLIIAVSSPSLHLFHSAAAKSLIGALILPETSFAGNTVAPSLKDSSCNLYSLDADHRTLLVAVQCAVSADLCHAVAKMLVSSDQIAPEKVLILDSIQSRNFRGRLSRDEAVAFKLETTPEKRSEKSKSLSLEYLPSGSVVDGLGAALLARCEVKRVKAMLCVSWPEFGGGAVELIKARVLSGLKLGLNFNADGGDDSYGGLRQDKDPFDSDLYC